MQWIKTQLSSADLPSFALHGTVHTSQHGTYGQEVKTWVLFYEEPKFTPVFPFNLDRLYIHRFECLSYIYLHKIIKNKNFCGKQVPFILFSR